nr:NADH dehydrogenase subunit 6 [Clerus klapperichi]WIL79871.1 NADH dehydrogenase subunit 6 [Clerus dealbatus]
MKILLLMSMILSIMLNFLSHPMSLGFILLLQTTITAFIINYLNFNFWFSYILFLVMIGGMLILFIYMTSVASNEKFSFNNKLMMMLMFFVLMIIIMLFTDSFMFNNMLNNFETFINNKMVMFNSSLNKYFNYPNLMIYCMTIIYLLITLIAVVKISNINSGPLRSKN